MFKFRCFFGYSRLHCLPANRGRFAVFLDSNFIWRGSAGLSKSSAGLTGEKSKGRRLRQLQGEQQKVEDADRSKNIVRGIGLLSVQGVLSSLLGLVLLGSLLRFLPSLYYGAYSALQVSIGIAGTISIFGVNAAVVRYLAPASSGENVSGWGAAKASLILVSVFSASTALVLVIAAPGLSDYFMKNSSWSWVFYLGALWIFTSSVSNIFQGTLQALRNYALLAKALLASRVVAIAFAIVGVIVYQSLAAAILSWVVYYTLISVVSFAKVWRPLLAANPTMHYMRVLRYAAQLGVAAVVAVVASNADIVVVGGYLDPVSLGVYNATIMISTVISSLFVAPLSITLFAESAFSSDTPAQVSRGVSLALRFLVLTVLPASLFSTAVAPQLLYLFSGGGTFVRGIPYLQLITLFYPFFAVQAVVTYVLLGVGKTRQVLIIGIITALGEIGLSASLVPVLSLAGAAVSRVTVFSVGCAVSLYFIRPYLKGAISPGFLSRVLVSAGVPALAVFLLSSVLSNRVISLVPYAVVGMALFFACAKALRLFNDEDRLFIAHLLPVQLQWIAEIL